MKKKLSLLIVAFMALAAYAGLNAWRTASSEVVYTLEQVKNTSQNAYDTPYDMTSNGITWSVEANISTDDGIRIGGKSLDKVDKLIYSKNKLDKAVGKITINHYGVTSENMKVHSVTLTVASDADFSNVIETQTKTDMTIGKKADGTIDFEPASGEWAANSYYKFAVNVSNSSSSKNYAFVLKSIVFYGVASGGEGETGETKTVYLKPGVWNADGARFAAYLFKGEENTWVDFSSTPGADGSTGTYFKADIPVSYTTMILVRMKSGTTENNWDNDWNQTDDIDISELADNTLYRITSWGSGSNSPYDTTTWPEQSTDPDPQTEDDVYYAVGVDELWGWSKADANKLVKGDDGKYRITKENAMLPAGEYGYKIMKNDTYVPEGENNEKKLKIERSAYYNVTLTLDPTADPLVNGYEAVATIANRLNSIAEVQAADAGTDVAVEGVVYASAKNGAVLYDYQDYLFYYNTSNALTVGQKVVLTGKVGKYGGASQLTKDATIYNIGTVDEIVYPNPVTLTGAEFDAIKTAGVAERKYVTFNGKLTVSGNYYNVAVPGAESAVASIVKPSDDVYKSDLNGKDITVKGYLMYVNNQYVYVVATSIEEYVAPVTINSMSIVGELTGGWPNTETGDWSMAKEMTKSADNPNIWTLSVAEFEAEAKEYQYKATANGKYGDYELPSEGNKKYTFTEAGKYSLLFTADTEKHELTLVATKAEPDKQTFTATFKNSIGWADVYAYAWSGEGESVVEFNGSFPGVKLEKDETIGVYKYSVEAVNAPEKIIFSNGLTGEDLQQTEDLVFTNGAEYDKTASTEPATISKVQICGATDAAWTNRIDFELNSAAPEQPNTYYNVLDATAYTDDVEFKLVVNESEWLGIGRFEKIEDPEGLVDQTTNVGDGKSYNFILKNSNGKYQKYDFKASWKENPDAGAGWTLEVLGKEARSTTEKQTFTATFKNSIGWADVYAYAWSGEGESVVEFNGSFPGVKLEKDETIGVYKYSVEAVNAPEKIIFSNGLTGEDLQQTEDLVFTNGAEYDKTASTEPATISKVQICGATDAAWTNRIDFELNSAAPEQPNTYYNVLDATAYTDDVEFKLVVNESEWLGIGRFEKIEDPEGLVDQTTNVGDGKSYNFILKNSNGKYQKYDFKASWKENPDAGAGWTLEVLGKEARAEQPGDATWTVAGDNATLFGETWKPALTANDMVKGEDGLYKWEKTEQTLTAGDVLFKVVKNHSWDNEAYPSDNYKLTIPENGKYTVTITFDAEKKEVAAVATKTGDVVIPDAEITSVQMPGDWNWALEKGEDNVEPYLVLTKGENNTWTGVLDLTEVTTDQKFKLVVNKKEWLGLGELTLNAGELVSTETDKDNNFILLNATSGYQTYDVTATWEANASAKAGWTLTIAGKDERPVVTEPVYTLVGAFYDGEGKESASFFGESWKVLEANNLEKIYDEFYKKEYTGINLEKGNVSLKVLKDGDWDHPYPNADGYNLEIPSAGVYDLTFTFHPDQSVVRGEADKKSDPIEITRMDIVGDFTGGWPSKDETSGEWDWSVAKAMTQDATNPAIWTLTVEGFKAEAKTYEYKATANGQYGVYELPASGNNNWVFGTEAYPAGKYDLLFTANTADNSLTVVPTLKEVETVILDEEETLAENQVLEVDEPFTSDEITVEDGQIITIEADEAGESLVPRRAFRALAASDITIQYKPEAGSDWQDAPVTVETNETGYQFEVTGAVATAINDRGFAIKANKPIVVTQVAVVTEVTPDPEPEPVYYAVGVKALWGVNDWTVDDANKLTLNGEGKYTITKTELTLDANTNYGYKVVKKVGDTQYWIPDGMDNEKNLTVTERAVYSVTLTLDPAEPLTAESFNAVATKTGEAEPAADAEITKVEIRGSFNGWDTPADGLVMTKQGETNTYTATLDLTEITEDVQFKLVLNNMVDWLGWGELELVAPENWTEKANDGNNIVLKNASTGYKTYTLTATWTPGPVAKTGWKLEIAGKDERPAVPATITKVELRGEFTSWSDGEGVELTKQGETDTYAGVLDLSEITADQAFKLVINDKTYWIDFNHIELSAPDGWLSKEAGDASEPAIILANATTGYKTYDVTATWTPSTDASAGWKLEIAGKDARETTPEPEANYYIVGSMTDWTVKAEDTYKLTLNENAEAGVTEYMKTIDFAAGAEFKVVKVQGETQTWYPDGMDNNYVITNASNYTVYFRPNGDGGEGWHYGYIYAVDNNPAGINALKVAIQKGAEVYTINGQRVQNPTKGLYIVNGRKVVIK